MSKVDPPITPVRMWHPKSGASIGLSEILATNIGRGAVTRSKDAEVSIYSVALVFQNKRPMIWWRQDSFVEL